MAVRAGELTWEALPGLFPELNEPGRWLPLLQRHAALVEAAAERVRVTAVGAADAVRRQYAESLELLRIAELAGRAERVADVGSGGGFPGLVVAAVRPDARVDLIEPLKKRAVLLGEMAEELGLRNVAVHAERAEDCGRGPLRDRAGLVTARAVAELRELVEYTAPLAAPGGLVALPKGSSLPGELEATGRALEELGCEVAAIHRMRAVISEMLSVVLVRKVGSTPERFPRRAGVPGKRPL
ncbi:16S rRNA (guanine(527)-N(7))-methyltransferase RsmG [bacterium]|nr:MAG: 16S rRNA (guanine(527)-N(7))-methyltransferase RsmG [bacterium]